AIRGHGAGLKVCILQFLKGSKSACGEYRAINELKNGIVFKRFDVTHPMFTKGGNAASDRVRQDMQAALSETKVMINQGNYDIIVLDEILNAAAQGFVKEDDLLDLIRAKAGGTELVLTGRGATQKVVEAADYVTEMLEIKHPYACGIKARKGIEF
ncbi:MAG: cob(I)yrinic acid a,c-diamide adenosyltransferase, partial [Candidatus Omnitrophota bacterium]